MIKKEKEKNEAPKFKPYLVLELKKKKKKKLLKFKF